MFLCSSRPWAVFRASAVLVACFALVRCSTAQAQLVWSFEPDLEGWTAADVTLTQSAFGATEGSSAMLMDNLTSTFKNDVGTVPNFGPSTSGFEDAYNLFASAADVIAGGGTPKFEFDLPLTLQGSIPTEMASCSWACLSTATLALSNTEREISSAAIRIPASRF